MNYDRTPFDLTLGRIPLTLQYDVLFISFLIAQSAQNSLENGCNKPKPDINHDVIFLIELNWWEEKGGGTLQQQRDSLDNSERINVARITDGKWHRGRKSLYVCLDPLQTHMAVERFYSLTLWSSAFRGYFQIRIDQLLLYLDCFLSLRYIKLPANIIYINIYTSVS